MKTIETLENTLQNAQLMVGAARQYLYSVNYIPGHTVIDVTSVGEAIRHMTEAEKSIMRALGQIWDWDRRRK